MWEHSQVMWHSGKHFRWNLRLAEREDGALWVPDSLTAAVGGGFFLILIVVGGGRVWCSMQYVVLEDVFVYLRHRIALFILGAQVFSFQLINCN